jgi:putative restriction endonuclease
MSLAQYLNKFSRLRTYRDRNKWSILTTYQAPHKPFLLLSVMDLIAQGSISERIKICLT